MAHVEELVRSRLPSHGADADYATLVSELDHAVFNTGSMVELIYEQVVHPEGGVVNIDRTAATAVALMSYLGHVGTLVDALDRFRSLKLAPVAQG